MLPHIEQSYLTITASICNGSEFVVLTSMPAIVQLRLINSELFSKSGYRPQNRRTV